MSLFELVDLLHDILWVLPSQSNIPKTSQSGQQLWSKDSIPMSLLSVASPCDNIALGVGELDISIRQSFANCKL